MTWSFENNGLTKHNKEMVESMGGHMTLAKDMIEIWTYAPLGSQTLSLVRLDHIRLLDSNQPTKLAPSENTTIESRQKVILPASRFCKRMMHTSKRSSYIIYINIFKYIILS